MSYEVKVEQFQGPFDVLLQLIEQHELTITDISLADITAEFISYLDNIQVRYPEELADFLVVAARLLYLKSRALLPYLEATEDDSTQQLAEHLKMYREFRVAAEHLAERVSQRQFSMERPMAMAQQLVVEFSPPEKVTMQDLAAAYRAAVERMDNAIRIPQAAIRKAITLKEKITALASALEKCKSASFWSLLKSNSKAADKVDIVVTFLAILELVKQDVVVVQQGSSYSDIMITHV